MSRHGHSVTRTTMKSVTRAASASQRSRISALGAEVRGRRIHLVGAKGTGMAALAEVLAARGALLSGADVAETFQTQEILDRLRLVPTVGFAAADLPAAVDWVVHSAAYDRADNPQLAAAAARGVPVSSYPEALGALSRAAHAVAVSGVHGKTTTAALCGLLVEALDLPATVLTATGVPNFGGGATLIRGADYLVAETCEYRNHFANFHPRHVVVTSVELEHVDAFPTHAAVVAAFTAFACSLPAGGSLIYAADDAGAAEVAAAAVARRPDLVLRPYGERANGVLRIERVTLAAGGTTFRLGCLAETVALRVAGRHNVLNAAAAVAVAQTLLAAEGRDLGCSEQRAVVHALGSYRGGKRRTEVIGESCGVLVIDDYAHHPTELATTLAGLRSFYPERRLVVDFMSHTFSRTAALLDRFATAFAAADEVILHPVYASARETAAATAAETASVMAGAAGEAAGDLGGQVVAGAAGEAAGDLGGQVVAGATGEAAGDLGGQVVAGAAGEAAGDLGGQVVAGATGEAAGDLGGQVVAGAAGEAAGDPGGQAGTGAAGETGGNRGGQAGAGAAGEAAGDLGAQVVAGTAGEAAGNLGGQVATGEPSAAADRAGRALLRAVAHHHPRVRYCETFAEAGAYLAATLGAGDLLVTMGAGDNWRVGHDLLDRLERRPEGRPLRPQATLGSAEAPQTEAAARRDAAARPEAGPPRADVTSAPAAAPESEAAPRRDAAARPEAGPPRAHLTPAPAAAPGSEAAPQRDITARSEGKPRSEATDPRPFGGGG